MLDLGGETFTYSRDETVDVGSNFRMDNIGVDIGSLHPDANGDGQ